MLRIRDIKLEPGYSGADLMERVASVLRCRKEEIRSVRTVKRAVDARNKDAVRMVVSVDVTMDEKKERTILRKKIRGVEKTVSMTYRIPKAGTYPHMTPVVTGFGPAGMFCALVLARAGLDPVVIERGSRADERQRKVELMRREGILDTECNVQFGEGGAGTFSDGKLYTGVNDMRIPFVLRTFADHGAGEEITYDSKPHIGTDVLVGVVAGIREEIVSLGGRILFDTRLEDIDIKDGKVAGITAVNRLGDRMDIRTDTLILATGHSARDTFAMLNKKDISMEPKAFAMGVRIEHLQEWLDRLQYAGYADMLPPADYKINCTTDDGTGVFTFCMCPGGEVIASASEEGMVVTNGMSNSARDGKNCNSALLVTLRPEDFPYDGVLGGVRWQREIERICYEAAGGGYRAPAQRLGDFMAGVPSDGFEKVKPTYLPGVTPCDLTPVLPAQMTDRIKEAVPLLDRKLPGFADPDAVLTAPETRSSSPVRILRDSESRQSLSVRGLYPCGEGAGYAGGIMSAALDGIRTAESIIASLMEVSK